MTKVIQVSLGSMSVANHQELHRPPDVATGFVITAEDFGRHIRADTKRYI